MPQTTKKKPASKSSSNKKSPAKKSTASRKSTSSRKRKKKGSQLTLQEIIFESNLKNSLIFVIGLILAIIALFPGGEGSLWSNIHTSYYSLTGICGFFFPLVTLFFGIINTLNKSFKKQTIRALEILAILICVCGFIHINTVAATELSYTENIREVFYSDHGLTNGGVIGAAFGGAFFALTKSRVISNILCTLIFIAVLMLTFGITLLNLFTKMEKPAKKVSEKTGEAIEKTKTDYERIRRERAEYRETRIRNKTLRNDPAVIVKDFYKENDTEKSSEAGQAAHTPDTEKEKDDSQDNSFELNNQDMFTIFGKKVAPNTKEQTSPASDESSVPAKIFSFDTAAKKQKESEPKEETFTDFSDLGNEEALPIFKELPQNAKQDEKPVKVDPLTKEEAAVISNELDEALSEKPETVYVKPPMDCLNRPQMGKKNYNENELKANGERLISALNSFNVNASIVNVVPGPTVTRYELSPAPGVKISKFTGLADDLALHMAAPAGLRIEAPIPNKAAIGIEIPNKNKVTVTFREIIDTEKFKNAKSKLNVALGKDIAGEPVYSDLAKMPHLLVAGTTGSGKSVCLNTMIVSLLYNATPDEVKILLIDPKQVEFGVYNGLPHLLVPVVSDPRKASGALGWAVTEMLSRYKTLNANGVRDIGAYNSLCEEREDLVKMPQIVIFIDELSDLMTVAPAEVEDSIQRLAQMARAAGMHLVVATQRPSVDVITGVIKANIPSRIALTVKSQIDSRTIIDSAGAEKLMGYGDMLYYPVGVPKPIRVQGSYLTDAEIENVVNFIRSNGAANYDDAVQQEIERQAVQEKKSGNSDKDSSNGIDSGDDLLMRAIELFVGTPEKASISALQRHLGLGFAKAGRLMDTLEEKGIVGSHEGSKPRKVLITKAQWYEMNAMSDVSAAPAAEDIPFDEDDTGSDTE